MLDWQDKSLFQLEDFGRALEDLPAAVSSMMLCRSRTEDLLAYEIIQATSPHAPFHTYMAFLQGRAVFDEEEFVGYDIALVWEVKFSLKLPPQGLVGRVEMPKYTPYYKNLKNPVYPVDSLVQLGRLVVLYPTHVCVNLAHLTIANVVRYCEQLYVSAIRNRLACGETLLSVTSY